MSGTILVVDDSPDTLSLCNTVLEMDGYEVVLALGAKQALLMLAQIKTPHLILLDMRMEGISGTDFLLELERTHPEIFRKVPVVFLSALDKIPASKASGFIRKPIDIDFFLERVRNFIELGPFKTNRTKEGKATSQSSSARNGLP